MDNKETELESKIQARNKKMAEANQLKTFVWRDTLSDGFLPFREFTTSYAELAKKDFKDSQLFDEKTQTLVKSYGGTEIFDTSTGQKFNL